MIITLVRGTQYILKRMDWIPSVGGDANDVEGYGQLDTEKATAFHGEAVDQELFYPIQTIGGNGSERQRSRGIPLSRLSRSLLYIQSPHSE
jgi:hypothetical protein